jgi:hypothetical protein
VRTDHLNSDDDSKYKVLKSSQGERLRSTDNNLDIALSCFNSKLQMLLAVPSEMDNAVELPSISSMLSLIFDILYNTYTKFNTN